jgi:hypothetical protein
MSQLDWVGAPSAEGKPFKDIRNTRPSVAEEKARLLMELGVLLRKVPESVKSGSVNRVREWREDQGKAAKVAANSRASAQEIRTAINSFNRYAK